jgi:hypothetical protein
MESTPDKPTPVKKPCTGITLPGVILEFKAPKVPPRASRWQSEARGESKIDNPKPI